LLAGAAGGGVGVVSEVARRYRLKRVGAGPGSAVFECDRLLGESVEVVAASDYDALADALKRIVAVFADENESGDSDTMLWILAIAEKALTGE
jgi:hypothetical protein